MGIITAKDIEKQKSSIKFILNNDLIEETVVLAQDTLLDYIRERKKLTGSKEGCAEGDCGACTVLIGRLSPQGRLNYFTVNSCICLMASIQGCHVVTIEYLSMFKDSLHPLQLSMMNTHASQCGFCTPGIVMSLYGLWINGLKNSVENVERALQGNLCRCTGYGPIIKAVTSLPRTAKVADDFLYSNQINMEQSLVEISQKVTIIGGDEEACFIIPKSVNDLATLFKKYPRATIVSGATDVGLWVTKKLSELNPIIFINHLTGLKQINEFEDHLEIGACVTYSEATPVLGKYFPEMTPYFFRIGGEQVRNVGTFGGNIANGSPIGDMAPCLIALNSSLVLRQGKKCRQVKLADFFIDYGEQDIREGEFIEKILVPINYDLNFYAFKISKRRDEDITIVSLAVSFQSQNNIFKNIYLAYGGMAATPKRAAFAEKILEGKKIDKINIKLAQLSLEQDFSPLSDMRASNKYRMSVAKNLLTKFFLEYQNRKRLRIER